jgi:hypothetical protein
MSRCGGFFGRRVVEVSVLTLYRVDSFSIWNRGFTQLLTTPFILAIPIVVAVVSISIIAASLPGTDKVGSVASVDFEHQSIIGNVMQVEYVLEQKTADAMSTLTLTGLPPYTLEAAHQFFIH